MIEMIICWDVEGFFYLLESYFEKIYGGSFKLVDLHHGFLVNSD